MTGLSHGGDLEWAAWQGGRANTSLPAEIAVKNCGYVPPPDPGPNTDEQRESEQ
jgi:hypothetical protein